MVAYLTNARLTTVTSRKGYVSWGVSNLFLTPRTTGYTTESGTGPRSGIQP